jgi:hypothetical protein
MNRFFKDKFVGRIAGTLVNLGIIAVIIACGDTSPPSDKNPGAVVATPTLASKTYNSITINEVTAPGNGQTVEYAINTASSAPSNWQSGLTFSGLTMETVYYIFARSKANDTYNAGGASAGLRVTTNPANIDIMVRNTAEWNTALTTITNGGSGTDGSTRTYTITVSGNVMVNGSTSNSFGSVSNVSVTINGNGKLYILGQGSLLNIGSNQTVCIDSANLTLQGLRAGQNDSTLNNNRAVIYMAGGTLELRNGIISSNTTSSNGGGVYASSGNFVMSGGTITGNSGGGVYASNFTMSGGTISNNTSGTNGGGGVYASNFTLTGGIISGNTVPGSGYASYLYGGGVYVNNFTMTGGTISGNTVGSRNGEYRTFGGGVYITGNGSMTGGTISGNTADYGIYHYGNYAYGGGICVSGSFTKSGGGIIHGNDAANTADRNTASSSGHAVYWDGTSARYRNTTLGVADNISTNTQAGWGQ